MQDVIHVAASLVYPVQIEQVCLAEIDAIQDLGKVLFFASGEIVDPPHLVTLRQHRSCQRGSNEARNARYEVNGHKYLISS